MQMYKRNNLQQAFFWFFFKKKSGAQQATLTVISFLTHYHIKIKLQAYPNALLVDV